VTASPDSPSEIDALRAALAAEQQARRQAEARAAGAEAMIAHLKLLIAKLRHDRFGASAERGRKLLDQLELQLEELETDAGETAAKQEAEETDTTPVREPLPEHLPRERRVLPGPSACPCCGGKLAKLGETITETLEVIPRQWKVIQTVREKLTCRACETITQPPAPFHPIARGRAGPNLLAMIVEAKFGQHIPLNRQSETFAREGIELDVSTLADWVGACTAALAPLTELIRLHVMAAERLHGDDTTVPVWAKGKTITGRLWTYVRDDRPFGGPAPPAAIFFYSRDRTAEHPNRHLVGYGGILQADAYAGFNDLYRPGRKPGPITEAACWAHGRRKLFDLAQLEGAARRRGGAADRCDLRARAQHQRPAGGTAPRLPPAARGAAGDRVGELDAGCACQAVAPCRGRQGDGLHAPPLGDVHALAGRRPHLPLEQRRRAQPARGGTQPKGVAIRWIRSRRRTRGRDVFAHHPAKLNDVDPRAWLADVLARIADHPASQLHQLLPWNWAQEKAAREPLAA
jgi:transposase